MPRAKRSKSKSKSKKEETLPDPNTLNNGNYTYVVSGWSSFPTVESISEIAEKVTAAHTAEDGSVGPLPRTSILLLPDSPVQGSDAEEAAAVDDDDLVEPTVVELVDQMMLEGVSRYQCAESHSLIKMWVRPPPPEPPVVEEKKKRGSLKKGKRKKSVSVRVKEPEPAADDPPAAAAVADAPPPAGEAEAAAALEAIPVVVAEEEPPAYMQFLNEPAYKETSLIGADFASRDAVVKGRCFLQGMAPRLVVAPQLPPKIDLDAVTLDPPAAAAVVDEKTKRGKKGSASKRNSKASRKNSKKKLKLTPEQMEELEAKKAALEAEYIRQTEEAIQKAQEEADYLMTFAHPDRWAKVVVSHMTFSGSLEIHRAHVTFRNCCFTSPDARRPQVTVAQYCRVEFIKCTFESPVVCGLYTLPTAQVKVKRCLFTGAPQSDLWESTLAGVAREPISAAAPDENAEGAAEQSNEQPQRSAEITGEDWSLTSSLEAAKKATLQRRPESVGVHTDAAKISVEQSVFIFLGVGLCVRGSFSRHPLATKLSGSSSKSGKSTVKTENFFVTLSSCALHHLFNTAIIVDGSARYVSLLRNRVSACSYYGFDCLSGAKHVRIWQNAFGTDAAVRVRDGASTSLLHNEFHCIPVDDNKRENLCMQPVY